MEAPILDGFHWLTVLKETVLSDAVDMEYENIIYDRCIKAGITQDQIIRFVDCNNPVKE